MRHVELVGILNVTPDSFSDGGQYNDPEKAITRATEILTSGASYLDIGAESTRPGAVPLSHDEEWSRLQPVLSSLLYAHPSHISLDTYHPETVYKAALLGSFIVNDVTAFNNPEMIDAVSELMMRCIVSHLPEAYGQSIQQAHQDKPVNSIEQVRDELLTKRAKMIDAGIEPGMIILDPGIGFGKTPELNWKLLEFAKLVPEIDVMIGYSRKKFLGDNRMDLEPNLEAGKIAIAAGTKYLRVHDVVGHRVLNR